MPTDSTNQGDASGDTGPWPTQGKVRQQFGEPPHQAAPVQYPSRRHAADSEESDAPPAPWEMNRDAAPPAHAQFQHPQQTEHAQTNAQQYNAPSQGYDPQQVPPRYGGAQQYQDPYAGQYPNQYQPQQESAYTPSSYVSYDQKASRIVGGIFGALFLGLAVFGLIWYYRATHPAPVPTPLAYTLYSAGDNSFSIDQPVGWDAASASSMGVEGSATFTSGQAKIFADANLGGSLNGDMLAAQNAQQQQIADEIGKPIVLTPPIVTIHREGMQAMQADYADYSEQPMQPFTCPDGGGYYSEFTGDAGGFIGRVHGYRATLLTNQTCITIIESCRESDWPALHDAFLHVLESVAPGKSG